MSEALDRRLSPSPLRPPCLSLLHCSFRFYVHVRPDAFRPSHLRPSSRSADCLHQFITARVFDSIPACAMCRLRESNASHPEALPSVALPDPTQTQSRARSRIQFHRWWAYTYVAVFSTRTCAQATMYEWLSITVTRLCNWSRLYFASPALGAAGSRLRHLLHNYNEFIG